MTSGLRLLYGKNKAEGKCRLASAIAVKFDNLRNMAQRNMAPEALRNRFQNITPETCKKA